MMEKVSDAAESPRVKNATIQQLVDECARRSRSMVVAFALKNGEVGGCSTGPVHECLGHAEVMKLNLAEQLHCRLRTQQQKVEKVGGGEHQ